MEENLICGAGPIGMTCALMLHEAGHSCRIIEKKLSIEKQSRAILINAASLQYLEHTGLTDKLLARGYKIEGLNFYRGETHTAEVPFDSLKSKYNFGLGLAQDHTEAILEEELGLRGIIVERGKTLTDLKEEDGQVRAIVEGMSGREEIITKRIIGADGYKSNVRDLMGIGFPGEHFKRDLFTSDIKVTTNLPLNQVHIFFYGSDVSIYIPMTEGTFRLISTEENIEKSSSPLIQINDVLWHSSFHFSERLAETFMLRNAVLMGDAAHVHSPAGGRGMNNGIRDAAVFVDRLQKNTLEGYSKERRDYTAKILFETGTLTKVMVSKSVITIFFRKYLLPYLLKNKGLKAKLVSRNMGID